MTMLTHFKNPFSNNTLKTDNAAAVDTENAYRKPGLTLKTQLKAAFDI